MTDLEREINRIKEIIAIHEGRSLISEGAETRNMKAAKHYLYDKLGYDEQQAMKFIGTVKTDIPNSRLAKCKFMLGVVRMACDKQLKDGQTIMSLNKCLKYVASDAHVNEYDNDLNGLSVDEIVNRFSGVAQADLENDKAEVGKDTYDMSQSQYKIVRINSFKEAEQYGQYTSWCVTHYNNMFNAYTSGGEGVFYFCLRNGFEYEPKEEGEGCPLDSYGLSMIAVSINSDGSVNTITCRWNHDNGGNDNIMTPKELSQVINMNFYEVFKPRTKEEIEKMRQQKIDEAVQYILENFYKTENYELLNFNSESLKFNPRRGDKVKKDFCIARVHDGSFIFNPEDIKMYHKLLIGLPFDNVYGRAYDMIRVDKDEKFNFVTTNGQLLSPTWFDEAGNFSEGLATVDINGKWNYINIKGQIAFPNLWFDSANPFYDGYAIVEKDGKSNFINIKGQLVSPNLWFDYVDGFDNGYAPVEKDRKWNYINANGQIISPNLWFDYVDGFDNGYAPVEKDGKRNYINANGQIISPNLWFDYVDGFDNGYAPVEKDGKWNFVTTNGQLLFPRWFDEAGNFSEGLAPVKINGKWNYINIKGQIAFPNLWFDSANPFYDGHAIVEKDGKWSTINIKGQLS